MNWDCQNYLGHVRMENMQAVRARNLARIVNIFCRSLWLEALLYLKESQLQNKTAKIEVSYGKGIYFLQKILDFYHKTQNLMW